MTLKISSASVLSGGQNRENQHKLFLTLAAHTLYLASRSRHCCYALRMALVDHLPHTHHSDQGVHYAAHAYIDLLSEYQIEISMAAIGKPEENSYAEPFMRTIKEEEVDLSNYCDFADAVSQIGCFIEDVYMTKRIDSSLGYLTPVEFEAAWLSSVPVLGTP